MAREDSQFARPQENQQLAAGRVPQAHPGDPALLELCPSAREFMHDLRQVGFVADQQRPPVLPTRRRQRQRLVRVQSRAERRMQHRVDAERLAREPGPSDS
jgi:hypothetical protein